MNPTPTTVPNELGTLLRYWRNQRGKSQLDLSLDAGISQRHLSFVESGRSTPSRDMLLNLSQSLDIPLRERNALLLASGYAPAYFENEWEAPEMAVIAKAIDRVLTQHEPHPALLMDRYWNILKTNDASPRFFGSFIDLSLHPKPRNLLHLMFDPNGMRPFIYDWPTLAAGLLQRVHREAIGHVIDRKTIELLNTLRQYPGADRLRIAQNNQGPVLPITFIKDNRRQSYFSLVTTVGTPQSITTQELRIETMFLLDSPS